MGKITNYLLEHKYVTEKVLNAKDPNKNTDEQIAKSLLEDDYITQEQYGRALAAKHNYPFVSVSDYPVNRATMSLLPEEVCRRYALVPLEKAGDVLTVALSDPSNVVAIDDVRAATRMTIHPVVATRDEIMSAINLHFRADEEMDNITTELEEVHRLDSPLSNTVHVEDNAPIVRFVNLLITQAIQDRASDIHVEPRENDLLIRFRIDGVLHEVQTEPKKIQSEIISRIKIMSDMDISERRKPQDGRMTFVAGGEKRDLRVASLPIVWGEKIVLRILDSRTTNMSFEDLGLNAENLAAYRASVMKPWGMTLVTGPTGSGKTTTLYASLSVVSGPSVNVITVEDPVEYRMAGVNQMQVNPKAGLTFANALRSILRADPNIVMIGEIRDQETAQIAVEAALTGHLVLSTLHTNDAPSAVTRLIELGVEPFLVASSLDCVMAQRLARRLCEECKVEDNPSATHLRSIGFPVPTSGKLPRLFQPVGCSLCSQTGYRGRIAIQEVMTVSEEIERLILDRASSTEIETQAKSEGMTTLLDDGFSKVATGLTTIEEVLRVVA